MYKILKAEKLAVNIYLMDVEAPLVLSQDNNCEPGQFVIVKMDEKANVFHLPFVITTERQEL